LQVSKFHRDQRYQILPAYAQDGVVFSRVFQGSTEFFDLLRMMKRCVIHDYNGLWFRPLSAMFEKLLNEILKYSCISRALEYSRKDNTIFSSF
jgi:hypothetical protein